MDRKSIYFAGIPDELPEAAEMFAWDPAFDIKMKAGHGRDPIYYDALISVKTPRPRKWRQSAIFVEIVLEN